MTQIVRSTLALFFAFGLYIFPQIVMSEVTAAKIMNNQISDSTEITKKNNDIVFYTLSEKISISLYKNIIREPGSCAKIKILANKLIDLRSSSQQAHYMLAACAEQEGNLEEALRQLQLSLSVEEFNTVYLLSLAIIQLNLNDLEKSQKTLDFISQINISTAGVDIVQDELTRRKFGNSS